MRGADYIFSQVLVTEGTAPSTTSSGTYPGIASGKQALFIDVADHLLKVKNSSGTVTPVGSGTAGALTLISKQTLGVTTATIAFATIPNTYSGLMIQLQGRANDAVSAELLEIQFNADTAAHYDSQGTQAAGSGASTNQEAIASTSGVVGYLTGTSAPANTPASNTIYIPNYAGAVWNKQWLAEFSLQTGTASGQTYTGTWCGGWRSNAAITGIVLFGASGSFLTGTVACLYGIS